MWRLAAPLLALGLAGCFGGSCDVDGDHDAAFEARYLGDADVAAIAALLEDHGWNVSAQGPTHVIAHRPLDPSRPPAHDLPFLTLSAYDGQGAAEGSATLNVRSSREAESREAAETAMRPFADELLPLVTPHMGELDGPVRYIGGPVC